MQKPNSYIILINQGHNLEILILLATVLIPNPRSIGFHSLREAKTHFDCTQNYSRQATVYVR